MRTPDLPAGGRRSGVVIITGLAVTAVVVGAAAISLPSAPETVSRAASSRTPGASIIHIDRGPSQDPSAVDACAGQHAAKDADTDNVEVLYDVVQQATAEQSSSVLVLRDADGDLRLCDANGADAPSVEPLPEATAAEPVVQLSSGAQAWDCAGAVLRGLNTTTWLLVHDQVARVQQRFVVDGAPGPWFSTQAFGGMAHLHTWLGPQTAGVEIVAEQRALDASGQVVERGSWSRRASLAGCPAADGGDDGDAQIL